MFTSPSREARGPFRSAHALTFTRCGEYWNVHFQHRTLCVRDSKGIEDLSRLVATPLEGLHVMSLYQGQRAAQSSAHAAVAALSDGMSVGHGSTR